MSASLFYRVMRFGCLELCSARKNNGLDVSHLTALKTHWRNSSSEADSPERPKRPTPPFIVYSVNKKEEIRKANPNLNEMDIGVICGDMWRSLSVEEKQKLLDDYNKAVMEFTKKEQEWWAKLSDEQQKEFLQFKEESKEKRNMKTLINKLNKLGKPKKALTACNIFITEQFTKAEMAADSRKEDLSYYSRIWSSMSESQRKPYQEMARKDAERYEKEVLNWELRMMREGYGHLLFSGDKQYRFNLRSGNKKKKLHIEKLNDEK